MKAVFVLCVLVVAVSARAHPGGAKYTDKYDNVNLNEILVNRRLLVPYIKCLLDQGKCSPDGKELKSHIKEALENYCAHCTGPQRDGSRRVIGHLINHEPEFWKQLTAKYDRNGKFTAKYEAELRTVAAA